MSDVDEGQEFLDYIVLIFIAYLRERAPSGGFSNMRATGC